MFTAGFSRQHGLSYAGFRKSAREWVNDSFAGEVIEGSTEDILEEWGENLFIAMTIAQREELEIME
ncbi:hypothetical protein N7456_005882 [Penicillium angulare]|uniref:Uncharacterized protein n=1 Tax=Penicillium angulare TaxID=116970 RepID=A0A9W9G0Y4_9EURO|nr:hypothetical protein N7456_005882 [Penicillium angulare]